MAEIKQTMQEETKATAPQESEQTASKWINRQRTLVVCSRGVNHSQRHLANDLCALMPHAKKEVKIDRKNAYEELMELCHMRSCNNFIFLESRKRKHLYMWIGKAPNGPSYLFYVHNSKFASPIYSHYMPRTQINRKLH